MKILIVDDDFVSRKILNAIFKSNGECDLACSGEEAMAAVETAVATGSNYDLILLDIMMPGIDGVQVLKQIRELEDEQKLFGNRRAKIVMATSLRDKGHVIGSFHEGCDGYINKPYDAQSVLADLSKSKILVK